MTEQKFYICEHCGNLIGMVHDAGVPMMCCGQRMKKLEAGVVEASHEKHIPVVSVNGKTVTVTVGAVEHPMTAEHSILWVYLQTDKGGQRKRLEVGAAPTVTFALADEKPIAVYAYCNLHGLWMAEVEEPKVCDLKPVNPKSAQNYQICNCNKVSYFDILDAVQKHDKLEALMDVFEDVKNTTHCTTGCGGCYDRVIQAISEIMNGQN
jgi:superoxide reductase